MVLEPCHVSCLKAMTGKLHKNPPRYHRIIERVLFALSGIFNKLDH